MECENCTMCCKLMFIQEFGSKSGEWCEHCNPGVGCKIYHTRPPECSDFFCMYAQMDKCSEDLRPDNCKVIFEKLNDHLIYGTIDSHLTKLKKSVVNQIENFKKQGFSVLLRKIDKLSPVLLLAEGHTKEQIAKEFESFVMNRGGKRDGNPIIHN